MTRSSCRALMSSIRPMRDRIVSLEATPIATWSNPTARSSPTNSRQECSFIYSPIDVLKLSKVFKNCLRGLAADFHVETQALHFLDQHVERFRCARFERVVAFDDRFVDTGAPLHVVGFHGEQFLQRVSRAVSFQRPHFHFAKTSAAILRFATEWLLRDE